MITYSSSKHKAPFLLASELVTSCQLRRHHSPGLPQLDEPGGDVSRHDDQRVLQLPVRFGRQLAVDELAGGDDLLTHGVLGQRNITINITDRKTFLDR